MAETGGPVELREMAAKIRKKREAGKAGHYCYCMDVKRPTAVAQELYKQRHSEGQIKH